MFSLLRSRAVFALFLAVLCALFLNTGCDMLGEDEPDLPGRLDGDDGYFGNTVALRGDAALVGAAHAGAGKAFAYRQRATDWQQASRLDPGNLPGDANFSWDLAVHGDWAAVGAFDSPPGEARAPGAVYLFQQQGTRWTFQQKLTQKKRGSSTSNNAHFGSDAQLDGRWLAVSAVKEDRSATATVTGAVYLYRRNGGTWEEHVRLAPADLTQGDHFGRGLSISGNLLAVSAAQRNETNPEASSDGAVYVFRREGSGATAVWQRETKLFGRTAGLENTFGDDFGEILALDGNYLAVSASSTGDFEGAVYVFERQGPGQWQQVARLRARKEGYVHKHFGSSVALSGDCLTAGSTYEDGGRGAAYVFCREASGAWTLDERLVAGRRQGSNFFGEDVALDGDVALVGAPGEDREDGAAYLFERTPQGWVPFGQ